ncbi:MAG TPA: hypothetical protein VJL29_11155 [Thermoguttaceae bacterium]|nr:hypothetical protein [Thermoguttaceae bacterium]
MNLAQLRALVWLRWRLTRNQWQRGGQLNAVIMALALFAAVNVAVFGAIGGVVAGAASLSGASPAVMRGVWDVLVLIFLFTWAVGLVTDLQRSEIIDLGRLLHLPVSLQDAFLLNYLASLASPSLAMALPAMLGLSVGLTLGTGPKMMLLVPGVLGFFFMITAWTYCLRGWLAALMVNKRRRRAVVMGVTMVFILLFQLPNLVTNVWLRNNHVRTPHGPVSSPPATPGVSVPDKTVSPEPSREIPGRWLDLAHRYVPPLWLPGAAGALAEGRAWPAAWGALGMTALGVWGIARAYRGTLRFYRGGETNKMVSASAAAPATRVEKKPRIDQRILLEWTVPGVPEEAGAMALACFRSMSRAPEMKMALATNAMIFLVLGVTTFFSHSTKMPAELKPFLASGAVGLTLLGLVQVMSNGFGFDRDGFRSLVLLPTPRRHVLLGKNLALLPVALIVLVFYLVLATVLAHLRASDVLTAVLVFAAAFPAMSVLGNLVSILVPYHVAAGSLKPTKTTTVTSLLIVLTHMAFIMAMLPMALPAAVGTWIETSGGIPAAVAGPTCALALTVLSAAFYWWTLEPLGRLLQRRERAILGAVTREVE